MPWRRRHARLKRLAPRLFGLRTDLRKSIDALAALVQESFRLDPFSPALFVFCNRQRNKLKILYWEHNGFWLLYRRLERGTFAWPSDRAGTLAISARQLRWLLDGLELSQRRTHPQCQDQLKNPQNNRLKIPQWDRSLSSLRGAMKSRMLPYQSCLSSAPSGRKKPAFFFSLMR